MTTFQRRRLVLGLVLFALVALVALLFAIPKIQDDRVEAAESQLRAAGITGVVAQFSGRDGTLLGPAAQEDEALAAVTDRDGMRSLEYEASDDDDGQAIATTTTTVAAGAAATTTTVAPGQALQVSANVDGRGISLTGTVANDAEKKLLLDAAAAAFGPANVADQVVVSNGLRDEPSAGALNLFSQYLAVMGRDLDQGSAQVSGTTMAVAGTGFTKESTAALAAELEKYRTMAGLTVSGSVAEPTQPDAAGMQANLSDISGRSGITFASGSAQIDAPSQQVLDVVAQSILAGPVAAVEIGGHTDSEGTEINNQRLSLQRAEAVRTYLITKGVAAPRLVAKGFGSTVPIADNATPEGRAQNRRIEFVVTGS